MNKFPNPAAAGRELAVQITSPTNTIVLAIVSGGLFVGSEVARALRVPFELLFIRRLLAPSGPEKTLCATNVGGTLVLDDDLPPQPTTPVTGLDHSVADGLRQLSARERFCRAEMEPASLAGKNVILVDNGIHTGSTMLAAIRGVRKLDVCRVVAATPVSEPNGRAAVGRAADEVVCLASPEKFGHVGLWYENFVRPTEDQIRKLYSEMMNE